MSEYLLTTPGTALGGFGDTRWFQRTTSDLSWSVELRLEDLSPHHVVYLSFISHLLDLYDKQTLL